MLGVVTSRTDTPMSKLRLTLACWGYDRLARSPAGAVQPDGIELVFLDLPVEETFFRMLRYREFDVSEMSLSSYTVSLRGRSAVHRHPGVSIADFRHCSIFVAARAGSACRAYLAGKRVGVPNTR